MIDKHQITTSKDKVLFTPGPLTTSRTIKQAMLRDLGSRDFEFIQRVADIRQRLLQLAGVSKGEYEAILATSSPLSAIRSIPTLSSSGFSSR